jgi:hypothetical protein
MGLYTRSQEDPSLFNFYYRFSTGETYVGQASVSLPSGYFYGNYGYNPYFFGAYYFTAGSVNNNYFQSSYWTLVHGLCLMEYESQE